MKKLIKKTAIYFLSLKIIVMTIILMSCNKKIKQLKHECQENVCVVDSLIHINKKANWFLTEIPDNYKNMENDVMNYEWGKEIIIYFKY